MRRDDWLTHQLPVAMVENDFFVRFLTIFQEVADTVYEQIDGLDHQFDPAVASPEMVRTMGAWLGIDWIDESYDERTQREIVRKYAELVRWRGTKYGVTRLLAMITEGDVKVSDNGGVYGEGDAPHGAPTVLIEVESSGFVETTDLVRIVRDELPATVAFRLLVAGVEAWPNPPKNETSPEREEVTHG